MVTRCVGYQRLIFPLITIGILFFLTCGYTSGAVEGTSTLVSTGTPDSDQGNPAIYGDLIVWDDSRVFPQQIFLYNLTEGEEIQLTTGTTGKMTPAVHGNLAGWAEYDGAYYQIVIYFLSNSSPRQLTSDAWDHKNPVISGDWVVWEDYENGPADVNLYGYRLSDATISPLVTDPSIQVNPSVHGDRIVWEDYRNDPDYPDIFLLNTTTSTESRITTDEWGQYRPSVWGDRIVWQDGRAIDDNLDIWMYDLDSASESQITSDGTDQMSPAIYADTVFWLDLRDRDPVPDIYLVNLTTGGGEERLTPDNSPVYSPADPYIHTLAVSGDCVAWQGQPGATHDVFLFTITPGIAKSCPVAGFMADLPQGDPGTEVRFTDNSSVPADNPITRFSWLFGDGASSTLQNPEHIYANGGLFPVQLTVSNPLCRNSTPVADQYNITIGIPVARFTATPSSGLIPLTVVFTDTSTGSPEQWNWSFGDGTYSDLRSPAHEYPVKGNYFVNLTVTNEYGSSSAEYPVRALVGARSAANTSIDGITILDLTGGQYLIYDKTRLPDWTFGENISVLEFTPPSDRGFGNITLFAPASTGFHDFAVNDTIQGYLSGVRLVSKDIIPEDFSNELGTASSVNYMVDLPHYPINSLLTTLMYEGSLERDARDFDIIARRSGYVYINDIAYTVNVTTTDFPPGGRARWHMSVNSTWVSSHHADGRNQTFIERIADNRETGEVLGTRFLDNDPVANLDYFEAESPNGLSTFGLSSLDGSGNPFQLITLSVTSHVSPPAQDVNPASESDSDMPGQAATAPAKITGTTTAPTSTPAKTPPDTGRSAKVYTNQQGVVTQATRLPSSDGRAAISLPLGVVAKDAGGKPLMEISISVLPPENLPEVPSGAVFTFAGMAYDIGSDDATFSPPVTLTFTLPQAPGEQDYTVKSYDRKSGSWMDLPTTLDPATGIVTVEVSHLCIFALFTQPRADSLAPAATVLPLPSASLVKAQPPSSAVSIFMNMIGWAAGQVLNNLVVLVAVIILTTAVALVLEDKFPGLRR